MSANNQEIESKFYVRDLPAVENRLKGLGAVLKVPRSFEYNLRFDDSHKSFRRQGRVLRLRKYDDVRLTYKGPGLRIERAIAREEIELVVDDFDQARRFLEGLDFQVAAVYEKYRAMYSLDNYLITLDELPYGNFIEIEAENPERISELAVQLGLDPQKGVPMSYQNLFEQVRDARRLNVENLSFDEFTGIHLTPADLGVQPADE